MNALLPTAFVANDEHLDKVRTVFETGTSAVVSLRTLSLNLTELRVKTIVVKKLRQKKISLILISSKPTFSRIRDSMA